MKNKLLISLCILLLSSPIFAKEYLNLKDVVEDSAVRNKTYTLTNNETVYEDVGSLRGVLLTVNGNDYDINANSKSGITISNNQILNIKNVKEIKGFYSSLDGSFLNNNSGIVNIGDNITFDSNSTDFMGGAIVNTGYMQIGDNSNFVNNFISDSVYDLEPDHGGGAIYNNGTLIIGSSATFLNNVDESYRGGGGAVVSFSNVDSEGNKHKSYLSIGDYTVFDGNETDASGGAICNYRDWFKCQPDDSIVDIGNNVSFISNKAADYGAAIINSGLITIGDNVIFGSNRGDFSGAIDNSSIMKIGDNAQFEDNKGEEGGAVNNYKSMTIGNNAQFISNYARQGGAIYNSSYSTFKIGENAQFIKNWAKVWDGWDAYGGAIYNEEQSTISIGKNVQFISNVNYSAHNYDDGYGGAIYNKGTINIEDGALFENNSARNGGAIYNEGGVINLTANTQNIEFTGNLELVIPNNFKKTSNAIQDKKGTINLWTSDDASVIFNDRIASYDNKSVLNINKSFGTKPTTGKIILNEDMSGYKGTVNLYGGEIELQSKTEEDSNINTNKFFSGNINLNSGTLKVLNNSIDNIIISALTATSNANLKIDVDLSNNTSDNFTVINNVTGQINLTEINILDVNKSGGQITLFNNEKAPEINILTTGNYGGTEYKFTNGYIAGVLDYEQTGITRTFKETINIAEPEIRSYSFANDETVTEDLGILGGEQLTIFGNGYDIDGRLNLGIKVGTGQILNVKDVNGIKKFQSDDYGGFLYNTEGDVNVDDGTLFSSNSARWYGGAIRNKGSIFLGDDIIFEENAATFGGAIDNKKFMIIGNNATFLLNTAGTLDYSGMIGAVSGAILNEGTMILGDDSKFISNFCSDSAGAICNGKLMYIGKNAIFDSNEAVISYNGIAGNGGAILNDGYLSIESGATFINNVATKRGGAIHNFNGFIKIGENANFISNSAYDGDGGAIYNRGTINIEDGAVFENNSSRDGGAIYNEGMLNLIANTQNIKFIGNKANGISNAINDKRGTINLWASDNADIIFNDRITSEDNKSVLNINSLSGNLPSTGKVILNEDMSGYKGTVNLYGGTILLDKKGTLFGGNMFVDDASIDMANEIIQEHNFNNLTVNKNLNLSVDADLANKKMDTISAKSFSGNGKINVKSINVVSDAKDSLTKVLFTDSDALKDKITSIKNASSKLYKYDVNYNNNGHFYFEKDKSNKINPIISESAIANVAGGMVTQTTVMNQSFIGIDSQLASIKQAKKKGSLYASTVNQIFENENKVERCLWIRPYTFQETIKLNDLDVDNKVFGTLAGIDLAAGENSLLSFYLGYAGSEQKYEDIKVNQTGYIIGATGMIIKEKYYLGLTANVGFNKAESENDFGTDKFDTNMYSVAAKAGYNIGLGGNWMLEPNLLAMYGIINSESYETSQGAKIDGQNTSNVMIEPQIKLKFDLENGWQPYGLVGYIANINEKDKITADGTEFETDKINGYTEYGVGVNKEFINAPWNCYLQITGRNGDRNGFSGNLGIKYKF